MASFLLLAYFKLVVETCVCSLVAYRERKRAGWNGAATTEFHRLEKEPIEEPTVATTELVLFVLLLLSFLQRFLNMNSHILDFHIFSFSFIPFPTISNSLFIVYSFSYMLSLSSIELLVPYHSVQFVHVASLESYSVPGLFGVLH